MTGGGFPAGFDDCPSPEWSLGPLSERRRLVVRPWGAPPPSGCIRANAHDVSLWLDRTANDPMALHELFDMYEHVQLVAPKCGGPLCRDELYRIVLPALQNAFEHGELVAYEPLPERGRMAPRPDRPGPEPPEGPLPDRPHRPETTAYIALLLLDLDGQPVGGEPYRVTLPGGATRQENLDQEGFARIDRIEAGTCQVSFPHIDGREWGRFGALPEFGDEGDGVEHIHEVAHGDWLGRLAWAAGFRDMRTVWLHPDNSEIRQRRDPNLLFPGDPVAIPVKMMKELDATTDRTHRFQARAPAQWLRVRLYDTAGQPLDGRAYTLVVDGHTLVEGERTAGDGLVEQPIPPSSRSATISIEDRQWHLRVGGLNPMQDVPDDGVSGAQARLLNLEYHPGDVDGELGPRTRAALRCFQRDHGLEQTGALEAPVMTKLVELHGC